MNKRLQKIIDRLKEGNRKGTFRRDQIKKAILEGGFDFIITKEYNEIYDIKPKKIEAKIENLENYWLDDSTIFGGIEEEENKKYLKVALKYGYSYRYLYAEIKEDDEELKQDIIKDYEQNNISSDDVIITYNTDKKGIELSFNNKPAKEVLEELKTNGFKWHRIKKVWYAKETPERKDFVNTLFNDKEKKEQKEELNNDIEIVACCKQAKEEQKSIISSEEIEKNLFNNVVVKEIKKDIYVNALIPNLNKNDSKIINDEEIKNGSELQLFKVTDIVELNEQQYNYFINNLLSDYSFLSGKGGYYLDDDTEKLLYYTGVMVACKGKETLLIDPEGHDYARYLCKIVEDINGDLEKELNNITLDNKDYKEAYNNIKENKLYIVKFSNKKVLEDGRIILNRGLNYIKVVTGLALKELIKEYAYIDIFNLKEYDGNLITFKERLNTNIVTLLPNKEEEKLSKINMLDRLEKELSRANKNDNLEVEEVEKMKNDINIDDILNKFDNVEINNNNRLSKEDQEKMEEFRKKLDSMREKFNLYLDFYKNNPLIDDEGKGIDMKNIFINDIYSDFVQNTIFYSINILISKVYSYFKEKYNISLKSLKHDTDFYLKGRSYRANQNLNWYMKELTIDFLIDNIFNQLNGLNFKNRQEEELKERFKYTRTKTKGNNIILKDFLWFDDLEIKYNNEYQLSYSYRDKLKDLFTLIEKTNNKNYSELCNNLSRSKEIVNIHALNGIIKSMQIFKNGNVKLTFESGVKALEFRNKYFNIERAA